MASSLIEDSCELFAHLPSFLPGLLEGETLFSWSARYHRLSGNALAEVSSRQLFGNPRAGLRHDFPSGLDCYAAITQGLFGDTRSLAIERTLLGYYAPFLPIHTLAKALAQMRGTSPSKLKTTLGLMPSRVGAHHPLKACVRCMTEDFGKHGVTTWHLEHQWPSVWICVRHREPLRHLLRSAHPKELRTWLLPEDIHGEDWSFTGRRDRLYLDCLMSIADTSSHLVRNITPPIDVRLARYTYLVGAKSRGWLTSDGSLRLQEVRDAFLKQFAKIQDVPAFSVIGEVHSSHGGILGLLMRAYPGHRHPVKHALLVAFLFTSFDEFITTYGNVKLHVDEHGVETLPDLVKSSQRAKLGRLVETTNASVSSAAKALGVPVGLAVRWANKDGVQYKKRPRVLTAELERRLVDLIHQGKEYAEIAAETGVKKSFIRNYLARNAYLRQIWHRRRLEALRASQRQAFTRVLNANPGTPIKRLRLIPGNGISWLVRNDRDWLVRNLPMLKMV